MAVHSGSWFGLPDFGVTESVSNIFGGSRTPQGGSNLIGGGQQSQPNYQPPAPPKPQYGPFNQSGSVLGASTYAPSGGTSSGGPSNSGGTQQPSQQNQAPFEPTPDQPSVDYNAIFAPAFDALKQQEYATQGLYDASLSQAELDTSQRKQGLQQEQQSRLDEYGQQRKEAGAQTESAIQAARRQAAELQQGIQARYGGTTGTGRFTSEILGSQATRNIAQNQAALQNTLGKISDSENQLKTQVMSLINQEDQRLEQTKTSARAQLQQALADIGRERGRLESEKAQMRIDALGKYQDLLAQVNARNTAFKQQLYQQAQSAQAELDKLRNQAHSSYQVNLTPSTLSNFVSSGVLSPQQAQTLPIGADITGQRIDQLTPVGIGTTDNQDQLSSALGL